MAGGQHKNPDNPETKVGFNKVLLKEVFSSCDLTGHSAKMFIEECVKACLEQIHAQGPVIPVPALITFVRGKMGKNTRPLNEQVEELVTAALNKKPPPAAPAPPLAPSRAERGLASARANKIMS